MATTADFAEYVCDQISGSGDIRYRKMFGEYMVYVNDKPILLVCDNTVFVKILPCTTELFESPRKGLPYDGAKEHYILDIDDRELSLRAVSALLEAVPAPKPKKRSKAKKEEVK